MKQKKKNKKKTAPTAKQHQQQQKLPILFQKNTSMRLYQHGFLTKKTDLEKHTEYSSKPSMIGKF